MSIDLDTVEETFLDIVTDFHEPPKCENPHTKEHWNVPCSGSAVARVASCDGSIPCCLNTVLVAQKVLVQGTNHIKCHTPCWRIEPL